MAVRVNEYVFERDPKTANTVRFLRVLGRPSVIFLIKMLADKMLTYTEMMHGFGLDHESKKRSRFAYYLRKAVNDGLVKYDARTRLYYLTWRGIKAVELIECLDKIANVDMTNIEDAATKIIINLNNNKTWLEPLLIQEIRNAVDELKRKA
jgi:hypothetical protein